MPDISYLWLDVICIVIKELVNIMCPTTCLVFPTQLVIWSDTSHFHKEELFASLHCNVQVKLVKESSYGSDLVHFALNFQACNTAYMHPVYYVVDGDSIVDKWIPNRGW